MRTWIPDILRRRANRLLPRHQENPKRAVVRCHQGPLTVAGFLAPLVASLASGVEQNICDFPPICVWLSWSFSHSLWRRNKSHSFVAFERSRNRSKIGFLFPEEEEEEEEEEKLSSFCWSFFVNCWEIVELGIWFHSLERKNSVCPGGEEEEEECSFLFRV